MNSAQALFAERLKVEPTAYLDGRLIQCAAHQVKDIAEGEPRAYVIALSSAVAPIPVEYGEFLYWRIDDGDLPKEIWNLHSHVENLIRQMPAKRVIVVCHMGVNRSSLVVSLVLRKVLGVSGREAVAMVQAARPDTFTNLKFKAYVEGLAKP